MLNFDFNSKKKVLTPKILEVFLSKQPQNSPYLKQGEVSKIGAFFSKSNCKIL
jgi:hypothetical protein